MYTELSGTSSLGEVGNSGQLLFVHVMQEGHPSLPHCEGVSDDLALTTAADLQRSKEQMTPNTSSHPSCIHSGNHFKGDAELSTPQSLMRTHGLCTLYICTLFVCVHTQCMHVLYVYMYVPLRVKQHSLSIKYSTYIYNLRYVLDG